jgi:hypothetical protein
MGAIAEAFAAYAQPLIDQTDGSLEQLNKALSISQFCYNLSLLPDKERDESLSDLQRSLEMGDEEFDEFRRSIVLPMLQRHVEMFPRMHGRGFTDPPHDSPPLLPRPIKSSPGEKFPGTGPYEPCPCGSGAKYKFCCRKKDR